MPRTVAVGRSENQRSASRLDMGGQAEETTRPLRAVVHDFADRCFLDTDGVTRDAHRMVEIMDGWRPHRSDDRAGVRRNEAFDPDLPVVVEMDTRILHARETEHPGKPDLLFTIVPREAS
ncbi:MAG TPA: hypothetical protein VFB58_02150 [Chloroflexota bacterium]|nr:hypothetical protein [Chloroflexota bacterium]